MILRPLNKLVLIEPMENAKKSPGGVLLPDTASSRGVVIRRGTIREAGPDSKGVIQGDVVLYKSSVVTEVTDDAGVKFHFVSSDDLMSKVI